MAESRLNHNPMAASRMTRRATAPKELQELAHQIKRAPFSNGAPKEIPMINLHDGEAQAFRHLAHSIVSRTLAHESEYHRMKRPELSQRDWKLLKRHNTFNIYKRRSSREHEQGHATGNSKRPMVLCVGSIAGHLEDTLYGLHAKNHDEMQLILPYMSKNHVDCAFLAKLEEGLPTDPYRQLALKWHKSDALSEPKIMKLRDLCMLESMGISTDAQGERYAYCLLQSVDVAGCPPPPETSNVVRANLMSCCIFRQAPGTNVVNVYAKGMFDLGGDVPSFLVYSTSCSFMYSIMNAVESAESKRLTLLALQKAESIMSLPIEEISTLDLEYHELIRSTNMSSVSNSASSPSADGTFLTTTTATTTLPSNASSKGSYLGSRSRRQPFAQPCCVCSKKPAMASIMGTTHRTCGICLQGVCNKCYVKRRLFARPQPITVSCCKSCLLEAKQVSVSPFDPFPTLL